MDFWPRRPAVGRHLIVRIVDSRKCLKLLAFVKAENHAKNGSEWCECPDSGI
jgi:hypothetical protein